MLVVRCNKCGADQKTAPNIKNESEIGTKSKRCVYCGHTFKIHINQEKSRIVKRLE